MNGICFKTTQYLKDWFNGKTYKSIRDEKRENKNTIQELEVKYGISLVQWTTWALKGTTQDTISKKIGISRKTIYDIYKKISSLIFSRNDLSYEQFKKIIRRKVAIRLLRQGIKPKQIVRDVFKMDESNSVRNLKACFNNMSFDKIMEQYYKKL